MTWNTDLGFTSDFSPNWYVVSEAHVSGQEDDDFVGNAILPFMQDGVTTFNEIVAFGYAVGTTVLAWYIYRKNYTKLSMNLITG